jgi:hypothetical protein
MTGGALNDARPLSEITIRGKRHPVRIKFVRRGAHEGLSAQNPVILTVYAYEALLNNELAYKGFLVWKIVGV